MQNHRAVISALFSVSLIGSFFISPGKSVAIATASADEAPAAMKLSLNDAVRLARTRGFDVLLASTEVRGAEADIRTATALPNPAINGNIGWTLDCGGPCSSGTPWGWGVGLADQGLLESTLSNKRGLRRRVAERALAAAKFGRIDAERVLVAEAKVQYIETAAAVAKVDFTREVAASLQKSVEVNRVRYPRVIDEGQLFRVEQEAMKAQQEVDRAVRDLRQEEIQLAFMIGITGPIPAIEVDKTMVKFRLPESLTSTNRDALFKLALENRPDRRQAVARESQGEAQIALSKRQRFPEIIFNAQYAEQGTGAYTSQLPTLIVGATLPIPVLYRQEGEIRRAEADREAAAITLRRIDAVLSTEIESAFTAFTTARVIVARYESGQLDRASKARDITEVQYTAGSATLTDLLDAQRTFVQVNVDYQTELVNYWTAVFQLEQAVGKEFVQ